MIKAVMLALLLSPAFAAVKVGDSAPDLQLVKLIPEQAVANATWSALAGKPVVLEFWATWCGPCVGAIPHLNELAGQYKDKIAFLSISDEAPAVVEEFLKKRPIAGLVGIRPKSAAREYGVTGIPATFLVDAAGKIAAITHPGSLKPEVLDDFLAGRALKLPKITPMDMTVKLSDDSGPPSLFEAVLRPSTMAGGSSGSRSGRGNLTFKGATRQVILAYVFEFPSIRVTGDGALDEARYDLSISLPGANEESLRTMLRQFVPAAFKVKISRENRDTEVLVLKAPNGRPPELKEGAGSGSGMGSGRGSFRLTNAGMPQLARQVEVAAHRPVIDETGITGKFDFELKWDYQAPDGILDALRKAGFSVETARRPVEFLNVSK